MKVIAINGSPRKKWNTSRLLEKFVEGMRSKQDLELKEIHVYDYSFTGCRSCFACKLKKFETEPLQCRIRDDIHDLLAEVRDADGVVIGSPIYFMDLSAQLKAFLERLMYPGKSGKVLPAVFLYTMNAGEEAFFSRIKPSVDITARYWEGNFGYHPKQIWFCDTYQRDHEELYKKSSHDMAAKKLRYDAHFPEELERAFGEGAEFMEELNGSVQNTSRSS